MENIFAQRIEALRALMRENGWDAVIVESSDPHSSEYPAARWRQTVWLTGFTGEAAEVVVTQDHAGLWTDTRYFIQAVNQLEGSGVELHKTCVPDEVPVPEWLAGWFVGQEITVAVDGSCISDSYVGGMRSYLCPTGDEAVFVSVPDLFDRLWPDRPGIPQTPLFTVDPGESRESKVEWLRQWCREHHSKGILLSALDEIAWTLNVRASDIEYNPLVISYLLVSSDDLIWFVLKGAVEDPDTEAVLDELSGVRIERYDAVKEILASEYSNQVIVLDSGTANYDLFSGLSDNGVWVTSAKSPVALKKAVKNATEIEMLEKAMIFDGVAMEKFLYWLDRSISSDRQVSEWDASVKLASLRAEIPGYLGDSFETISAFGRGAALPHYITPQTDAPLIGPDGIYLCDSGGQYYSEEYGLGGTTDITRTVAFGECTELEKEDYTLVLKGHIDLAMASFPAGTPGCRVDALAREPLWKWHRNFGHGTGHGVGWCLGCHEGPQSIRQNLLSQPLLPGMICSDEPGVYREGLHGIRHENLLLCVEDEENEFGKWMKFKTLTLCHFDTSALLPDLLTEEERDWLNDYNARVRETLSPLLPEDAAEWLSRKTLKI